MDEILYTVSVWTLPVLIAVTFHEAAHGFAAWRLGDDTAKRLGRVTFNPIRHIDPFGTILLPGMLLLASGGQMMFGFAKPVPVNFGALRKPRRDMVLVAAAGPGINFLLAILAAASFHLLELLPAGDFLEWSYYNLYNMLWINLILGVFNLIPLPPLDGGRIAVGLLPRALGMRLARLERVGVLIILAGLFLLPWIGGKLGLDLNIFTWLVIGPAEFLARAIGALTGIN